VPAAYFTLSWTQAYDGHDAAQAGPGDRPARPDYSSSRAGEREAECLQGEQADSVDWRC
jgi:hypothetical protein